MTCSYVAGPSGSSGVAVLKYEVNLSGIHTWYHTYDRQSDGHFNLEISMLLTRRFLRFPATGTKNKRKYESGTKLSVSHLVAWPSPSWRGDPEVWPTHRPGYVPYTAIDPGLQIAPRARHSVLLLAISPMKYSLTKISRGNIGSIRLVCTWSAG